MFNTFTNVYNMGVKQYIPTIDHNRKNQVSWKSYGLKILINKKKGLEFYRSKSFSVKYFESNDN